MAKEDFLSSASDPLHPLVVKLAGEVLRRALADGTFVVISTKAMATPEGEGYTARGRQCLSLKGP
jgi:hypothetical protein